MIYVNLKELDHSPVNVRTNEADKTDVKSLAASIQAHGLLQPLVVTKHDKGYLVVAGNRRLAALRSLEYAEGIPVTVIDESLAREASLAENIIRRNLTPIELYEAIAALGDEGDTLSQKDIAGRFGQSVEWVRRAQRLGRVHPEIREAYRNGQLDDDAVQAFAGSTDPEEQLRVFEKLESEPYYASKAGRIRTLLGFGDHQHQRYLKEIGEQTYKDAGGKIESDLFGDNKRVSDPALLIRLYEKKMLVEDNQLADELGIPRIDDTEGYWRTWPKYRGTEEDEARIKEIEDTLDEDEDELTEDQYAALYDEMNACKNRRKPVLDEDKEYAVYRGEIYEKRVVEVDTDDLDEDVPFDDCERPAEDTMALTAKARDTLATARQHRRVQVLAATAKGFEAERFAFCALRCAFRHQLKGGTWLNLIGPMEEASWLTQGDDVLAWEDFLQADPAERGRVIHAAIGNLIVTGGRNELVDAWAADGPQPAWNSSPEFWQLFRKKEQVLQLIEEFAPRWAEAWGACKLKDIQDRAHAFCTGEIEVPGVTEEEKAAAAAWVPEWLRFGGVE